MSNTLNPKNPINFVYVKNKQNKNSCEISGHIINFNETNTTVEEMQINKLR